MGWFYLNENRTGLQINIDRITTSQEELKMRHWVITHKP
jgi:hypothetical protein